jgi:hypothetical protein
MNGFNPVRYAMEMKIIGFGLMITGVLAFVAMGLGRIFRKKEGPRG